MFKKIYLEITNACNFNCSFCSPNLRSKRFLSVEEFVFILKKIKPYTQYLYLHVLGEPLLHPQLERFLQIAEEEKFFVNITTNASLLPQQMPIFMHHPVRQINLSLHDWEENIPQEKWEEKLIEICSLSQTLAPTTYINLRLWNHTNNEISDFNKRYLHILASFFKIDETRLLSANSNATIRLDENIHLQNAARFEWQLSDSEHASAQKTCYALKDHIAILSDGSIVPCCIDANAHLKLGNIFEDNLEDVLASAKAQRLKNGFAQGKAIEDFCKSCGFR